MTDSSNEPSRQQPVPGQIPPQPPLPQVPPLPPAQAAPTTPVGDGSWASPGGAGAPPAGYGTIPAGYGTPPVGYGAPFAANPGQQPPYGAQPQGGGQPAPGGAEWYAVPAVATPPKPRKKWVLPVIAIVAGLAIAAASVGVTLLLTQGNGAVPDAGPSPTPSRTATATPEPSEAPPSPTQKPTPTATPTPQPTISAKPKPKPSASIPPQPDPDADVAAPDRSGVSVSANTVGGAIEGVLNEYDQMEANGELWQLIPHDTGNTYAYLAFRYLLTDLKSATAFGVDNAKAQEYWSKVIAYETKLLAQEPLGVDVTIETKKSYFHYDGTTGEGTYEKR
ncbi:hypothetical protein [Microbacterium sp. NC79]|uniref:hypothetical protein n=1 Tax=Microbacterium sp. NC79 TaxID=2851009 RepID=UPI001C2B8A02|nr:hypothetical protein [Microbacterium sp. NC79]MBV0894988.1 hypothetical protein [Microbacterium sp. NC79]